MINTAQIIQTISVGLGAVMTLFVLRQNGLKVQGQVLAAISAFITAWNIADIAIAQTSNQTYFHNWWNTKATAILFLPAMLLHLLLLKRSSRKKYAIPLGYITNAMIFLPALAGHLVVTTPARYPGAAQGSSELQWWAPIYLSELVILVYLAYNTAKSRNLGQTSQGVATTLLALTGLNELLPLFDIKTYPGTTVAIISLTGPGTLAYQMLTAYGLAREITCSSYKQMDFWAEWLARGLIPVLLGTTGLALIIAASPQALTTETVWVSLTLLMASTLGGSLVAPTLYGQFHKWIDHQLLGAPTSWHLQVKQYALKTFASPQGAINEAESILRTWHPGTILTHKAAANTPTQVTANKDAANTPQIEVAIALPAETRVFSIHRTNTEVSARDYLSLETLALTASQKAHEAILNQQREAIKQDELMQQMALGIISGLHHLILDPLQTLERIQKQKSHPGQTAAIGQSILCLQNLRTYTKAAAFFGQKASPAKTNVDLNTVLADVQRDKAPKATARGTRIDLVTHCTAADITGDPALIKKAINELVQNAIEATPLDRPNHIVITLSENARHWTLHITDTGCGIPEHQQTKLFTPYFTTKQPTIYQNGFGLGLVTAKKILNAHQAQISIQSQWGTGTTVEIRLPKREKPDPQAHENYDLQRTTQSS